MLVNYCGGWGYYKWVKQLKSEVEIRVPNAYAYQFERDSGLTGRFEVTVFKSADDLKNQVNGTLLHSKKNTKKFPWDSNADEFYENIMKHSAPEKAEAQASPVEWDLTWSNATYFNKSLQSALKMRTKNEKSKSKFFTESFWFWLKNTWLSCSNYNFNINVRKF